MKKNQKKKKIFFITKSTSMLFTGDAEGEGVDRRIGSYVNLRHIIKLTVNFSWKWTTVFYREFIIHYWKIRVLKMKTIKSFFFFFFFFLEIYNFLNESIRRILPSFNEEEF